MSSPADVNPYQSPESQPAAGVPPAAPYARHGQATLEELERRVAAVEWHLQRSWLFSPSFLLRALAVFGHFFALYLVFAVLMMAVLVAIQFFVFSFRGL
jgi:hypothetical protein